MMNTQYVVPGIDPARLLLLRTPAIGRVEAARRIIFKLGGIITTGQKLTLSDMSVRRGALLDMGGSRVSFPDGDEYESCYVGLVDQQPDAQWAHRALWAFVPVAGGADVVLQNTEFPEHALGPVRMLPWLKIT